MNTTPTTANKFEQALRTAIQWVQTHREQFWAIAGTVAGAIFLVVFMVQRRQTESDAAWTQLGVAQGYLLQGQTGEAAKALDQWNTRFQGSSATSYSKFLRADLLYRTSDYAGAGQIYGDLAQTGRPAELRPLAHSAYTSSLEMAGRLPDAQAAAQQFIERYPDHYLVASMYISQARIAELSGNPSAAAGIYDRFVVLYPQSPWTAFARTRLLALAPAPAPPKK